MDGATFSRFWSKVEVAQPDDCWLWLGSSDSLGYGGLRVGSRTDGTRRMVAAYRLSYEHFIGQIPEGLSLDHLCRNPSCVNPEHLEAVTHRENVLRGVGMGARWAKRDRCDKGHPLSDDNLIIRTDGGRRCRRCRADYDRERYEARKAGVVK